MEKINQLIEIVYDNQKRKLRARNIQDGRWCSFPNKLRIKNKTFKAGKITKGRGDSWRASKPTEFILTERNIEIEETLGLKNKSILKEFYDILITNKNEDVPKINTEMLNIIFTVKQIYPKIDEQILKPLIKRYTHSAFIPEDLIVDVQNLLINYNERRVVKLFSNYTQQDELEDTIRMYKILFENDLEIDKILPKKPKNIKELHDLFMRECVKVRVPNSSLKQEEVEYLNNINIQDKYSIYVPQKSHDLIDIGNELSICVGNGYYARKVLNKEVNIISLKNTQGKFIACIEFNQNGIIQAKSFHNSFLSNDLLEEIKETIFSKELKIA